MGVPGNQPLDGRVKTPALTWALRRGFWWRREVDRAVGSDVSGSSTAVWGSGADRQYAGSHHEQGQCPELEQHAQNGRLQHQRSWRELQTIPGQRVSTPRNPMTLSAKVKA